MDMNRLLSVEEVAALLQASQAYDPAQPALPSQGWTGVSHSARSARKICAGSTGVNDDMHRLRITAQAAMISYKIQQDI